MARPTVLDRKRALVSEAVSLVVRASQLIEIPGRRWTREHWALDGRGRVVALTSPQAARFCLVGAVYRAEHELHGSEIPIVDVGEAMPPRPLRVCLVLDVLAALCREDLARRFSIRFVEADDEEGGEDADRIAWKDLPVAYNSSGRVRHRDALRALRMTLILLLYLQQDEASLRRWLTLPKGRTA